MEIRSTKRLDVLFVHQMPVIAGATQSLLLLLKSLKNYNFSIKVLFLQHEGNAIKFFEDSGFEIETTDSISTYSHAYGGYRSFLSRRPYRPITDLIKCFYSVSKAREILLEIQPSVVYLNTSVLIPFAIAAHQLNIKVIWHLREQIHNGIFGFRRKLFRYLFKNYADVIISISKVNSKALGLNDVNVIYNSVDLEKYYSVRSTSSLKQKLGIRNYRIISFLGGSIKSKGALLFINAARIVLQSRNDVIFIIAGKFNTENKTKYNQIERRTCKELKKYPILKKSIIFTGVLPEVYELLDASDIVVWPAVVPHFSRPTIEAMAMGKPVLASDFESSREIIDDKQNGVLIKPRYKEFAKWIIFLLDNPLKANEIGLRAREKAASLFNSTLNNKKIIEIISNQLGLERAELRSH